MNPHPTATPLPRRLAEAAEVSPTLEAVARSLRTVADAVAEAPAWRSLLRGAPVGHALHPALTDVPLGLWMSSSVLDLVGPDDGRSADRLLGAGILASAPTALTGLADWRRGGERVRRVGALHAVLNTGALALYSASWLLRRRGHRGGAVAVSLAAGVVTSISGYLGGHMILVLDSPYESTDDTWAPAVPEDGRPGPVDPDLF
jgi:hypothetical protein